MHMENAGVKNVVAAGYGLAGSRAKDFKEGTWLLRSLEVSSSVEWRVGSKQIGRQR